MHAIVAILLCILIVGCKHSPPPATPAKNAEAPAKKKQAEKPGAGTRSSPSHEASAEPQAAALNETAGKVMSVNSELRFVVIDFALNPLPKAGQQLGIFRNGQKVGAVKISVQANRSVVAADITAGEAKLGDEVRPE
jgi:hypothetical protein